LERRKAAALVGEGNEFGDIELDNVWSYVPSNLFLSAIGIEFEAVEDGPSEYGI
jgi:hypothetical protein